MDWKEFKGSLKRFWKFFWYEDSLWSWILNIVVAFVVIKFLIFPGLALVLSTSHPVVAVVSESMEHEGNFDRWWENERGWYQGQNITKEDFRDFRFHNGFNKGDIMVLRGKDPENIEVGDTLIFDSNRANPIIHRVAKKWQDDDGWYFQTKGDNNPSSISSPSVDEVRIHENRVIGVAIIRVPFLGYVKIAFVELLRLFGVNLA